MVLKKKCEGDCKFIIDEMKLTPTGFNAYSHCITCQSKFIMPVNTIKEYYDEEDC